MLRAVRRLQRVGHVADDGLGGALLSPPARSAGDIVLREGQLAGLDLIFDEVEDLAEQAPVVGRAVVVAAARVAASQVAGDIAAVVGHRLTLFQRLDGDDGHRRADGLLRLFGHGVKDLLLGADQFRS